MSEASVTIAAHGVIDQARAESLAARIRAAVRNGRRQVAIDFAPDAVIASQSFLAFVLRAGEVLRRDGGTLSLGGDPGALAHAGALGIVAALGGATTTPGGVP